MPKWPPEPVVIQSNLDKLPSTIPQFRYKPNGETMLAWNKSNLGADKPHMTEEMRQDHSRIPRGYTAGYRVKVNEQDVTRRDWATAPSIYAPAPKTAFEQLRESIQNSKPWKNLDEMLQHSKEKVDETLYRASNKMSKVNLRKQSYGDLRQASKYQPQSPRTDRGTHHGASSKHGLRRQTSMFFTKSQTLSNIHQYVSSRFQRPATPPPEYSYLPIIEYDMPEEDMHKISRWISNTHEGEENPAEQDLFNVITTAQLLRMKGADINTIERLHRYRGPPSTPVPEKEYEPSFTSQELRWLEELEGEYELVPKRKDLIKYLGTEPIGLHIIKDSDSMSTYLEPANLSDYYGIPLIYPDDAALEEHEDLDQPDNRSDYDAEDEYQDMKYSYFIPTPSTLKPSHNIVLYLWNQGNDILLIAKKMHLMDPHFLHNVCGRVYKGFHIPEYHHFNDDIVAKLQELARAPYLEWEVPGALDQYGKTYPDSYKVLKNRKRERDTRMFVKFVVENHLWYRCRKGDMPHRELSKENSPMLDL